MLGRLVAPALAAAAAVLETAGAVTPAGYALVAAVPAAAVAALTSLARLADLPGDSRLLGARLETALSMVGTSILVAAAAVRSNSVAGGEWSSLTVLLVLVAAMLLALASLAPALPTTRRAGAPGDVALARGSD